MEFEDNLRDLMAEEYIEVMKPEAPPGIDMKHSDYYLTDVDKLYEAEYGPPDGFETSEDPKQKQRREAFEKQALAARRKHGITIFVGKARHSGSQQNQNRFL